MNTQIVREELKGLWAKLGLLTEYAGMAKKSGRIRTLDRGPAFALLVSYGASKPPSVTVSPSRSMAIFMPCARKAAAGISAFMAGSRLIEYLETGNRPGRSQTLFELPAFFALCKGPIEKICEATL